MKIPITKPFFDQEEENAVVDVLRSGWVTQGPKVAEFEKKVAEFVGVKYAIATTSATTGLFLGLKLLGVGPRDEVIVPSFSFIATANVVVHAGAKPVFVDIDPKTYNIDPSAIEKAITPRTKVIVPVDQVGLPCDMPLILKIAQRCKIQVLEDAACALGAMIGGKKVGSLAEIAVFSFHPRKTVTTGEGGMIVTNNSDFDKKLRMLRHHGMTISDVARHASKKPIKESYSLIGYNFRMSDIQAAVGVEQMKKLPDQLKKRTQLANRYTKEFKKSKFIVPPFIPDGYVPNFQSYVIRLKRNNKISRDELMQKLLDKGISTRIGVMASHLEPVYKKLLGGIVLPITEAASAETITLPLYSQMTLEEQNFVVESVRELTERDV